MLDLKRDACASCILEKRDRIFSGIEIVFFESRGDFFALKSREKLPDTIFEITHCREGRLEYDLNGTYCCLMPGDLAVSQTNRVSRITRLPENHCHGVTIQIDLEDAPHCLSCCLEDVNVEPGELKAKFCAGGHGLIVRATPQTEHIFSELYSVPDKIRDGYLKVKILELFLFLSVYDIRANEFIESAHSAAQVRLAREIERYLTDHISEHVTLKEISRELHLSETHIRRTFQCVYGVTPRVFILEQKIESAARMLEQTDISVLEIANAHGYENASKFSSAFRNVKGMAPNEYRNRSKSAG